MYQLSRLLHDHHRDLYHHFEMNDVAPTLYAAPWFLTIFASQFPIGFVARVFGMLHDTHNLVSTHTTSCLWVGVVSAVTVHRTVQSLLP